MKLAIKPIESRRGTKKPAARRAGFTLAEVMAALLFLAIVIPTAVEVLRIATLAGEVAARKSEAARVADRILSESVVTKNWSGAMQSGTVREGILDFRWTLTSGAWSQNPMPQASQMELLTAEVTYSAQGKDYSVKSSTLANAPTANAGAQQ
ncbi:MAG: type II secretion system protein [Verrucomicrobiota bacterium]|jgi:type II secretory pathway pseudopilin PulG